MDANEYWEDNDDTNIVDDEHHNDVASNTPARKRTSSLQAYLSASHCYSPYVFDRGFPKTIVHPNTSMDIAIKLVYMNQTFL